jgi:hypothetical protein
MGHIRLPHLPRTKRWQKVVDLVGGGGRSAAAVASATLDAIDESFASGADDAGLVRAVWLLAKLPEAAKSGNFAEALRALGVKVFPQANDVRRAIDKLGTEVQFGRLARDFFARFTERSLKYYVDRELPRHVGADRRFQTLADQKEFSRALELHCQQAAKIVEAFAGGLWSKARLEKDLSEERTARFVSYALKRMRDELRKGAVG